MFILNVYEYINGKRSFYKKVIFLKILFVYCLTVKKMLWLCVNVHIKCNNKKIIASDKCRNLWSATFVNIFHWTATACVWIVEKGAGLRQHRCPLAYWIQCIAITEACIIYIFAGQTNVFLFAEQSQWPIMRLWSRDP